MLLLIGQEIAVKGSSQSIFCWSEIKNFLSEDFFFFAMETLKLEQYLVMCGNLITYSVCHRDA